MQRTTQHSFHHEKASARLSLSRPQCVWWGLSSCCTLAHKLLINVGEFHRSPFPNQLLTEGEMGGESGKQDRWKVYLEGSAGALSKVRVETSSLSKYYLRQQPPAAARRERRAIDSRYTPSTASHPPLALYLFRLRDMNRTHLMLYYTHANLGNSNMYFSACI